ncbi:helix-turn-helix domain-containing protein [Haliscomenobacter sp.]|uniref:helix-turn-helix domain-containing protein n=1 Tax=Haliscomenobacter sp. TaxID=2717303 RepID=UPI003593E257
MTIYIQYMVSTRCKLLVKAELDNLGIAYSAIDLGEVEMAENLSTEQYVALNRALKRSGLALIDDKKNILIEKIKHCIMERIHYSTEPLLINFSDYLSEELNYNFNYISKMFAEIKGTTIEQYIILHKIERIKELLLYDELSLKEITHLLNYSSVAHLSGQFKKLTGLTPMHFKKMRSFKKRIALENV